MGFKSLKINNWKQFDAIDIEFHDRLTVLTGANASGKTTLLNVLARHFGWDLHEVSTPAKVQETGKIEFLKPIPQPFSLIEKPADRGEKYPIGEITYTDGSRADIVIPYRSSPLYDLMFTPHKGPRGMYIPSDRSEFIYDSVNQIPGKGRTKDQAFDMLNSSRKRARGRSRDIKEILIGWGIFGFDSKAIVGDRELEDMYFGFENLLREILPEELGFEEFSIRMLEVVLVTKSGEFMIDAVSGGIGALIDLALQIYLLSGGTDAPTTVLIDEVETHLHASMQRELMPSFLKAFPNVQFIVSTHSPLVVSSVRDSSVYVLRHNSEHKVESLQLDITNKAKDAVDILKDVLGVSFSMPVWVEEELRRINDKYLKREINEDTFASLRKELTEIGLEDLVPYSIDTILSSK
jgi:energy-coupling factor transporter ATP-binding protein EcfA2